MKKLIFLIAFALAATIPASAQRVAIKNNLLGDATLSPNLGAEVRVGRRSTLDLYVSWNPFQFEKRQQFRHLLIQPEYRYWTCEAFNGLFFGAHAIGIPAFNVGAIKMPFGMFPELASNRYDGWAYGGGVAVGYQWIIGKRWGIEAELGGGYLYIDYAMHDPCPCGPLKETGHYNYFGVTKASVAFIFFFN